MDTTNIKRLVILAGGKGTLFNSIAGACRAGTLKAKVMGLISHNHKALVLQKARAQNIPTKVIDPKDFSSYPKWDHALKTALNEKSPDLIVLAGFLKKIGPAVLTAFPGRIINIHPALLPRHGGDGMYGLHVHRSVLSAGDKTTGTSVHLVSKEYDTGPVLAQTKLPVSAGDTPESLQEKVKKTEQVFYVEVLQKILNGAIALK